MTDYNKEYPNLAYVLGYFTQYWTSLFSWNGKKKDFEALIRYFKVNHNLETTALAIEDCERLLSLPLSEAELRDAIYEFSSAGYSPLKTHREFFERVLQILKEPVEKTRQEFIPTFIG